MGSNPIGCAREVKNMNTGKVFEHNFKNSIPDDYYSVRLKDPAVGFCGGSSTFSPNNPYDYIVYNGKHMFCFELKSKDGAISFWDSRFDFDGKKHTFEIKKHQILGLTKAAEHDGIHAGVIINFRNKGKTVYIPIDRLNRLIKETKKSSINCDDAMSVGIEIGVKKLKVNERYDIRKLCEEVEELVCT